MNPRSFSILPLGLIRRTVTLIDSPASVLIVDDSRIYRAAVETALSADPRLVVVGSVFSGEKALEFIRSRPPDLVTLDVNMPGMDGLATLEGIQQVNRTLPADHQIGVIMLSAHTRRGGEITVRALQAGAFDFVAKPSGASADENLELLRKELLPRLRLFLARRRSPGNSMSVTLSGEQHSVSPPLMTSIPTPRMVRAILIGASTGGPKALQSLLPELVAEVTVPVIVVQHMPADFTRSLAQHLSLRLPVPVQEAEAGMILADRAVYLAPGGRHLVIRRDAGGRILADLNDQPLESGCRPSVSVMFRSAAGSLGREAVAIVLTGMGSDGAAGLAPLHAAGACVIVQDEASSVVWGMPGAVVAAGLAHAVLPLDAIATTVGRLILPGSPR